MASETRGAHRTPNGRPVHPACRADASGAFECQCERLHDYWDGRESTLLRRIEVGERMERRTRIASTVSPTLRRGNKPDEDSTDYHWGNTGREVQLDSDEWRSTDYLRVEADGFWREAENLKTIAGPAYKGHDDGRDHSMDFHVSTPVRRGKPC